jgi:hypothetical protein
MFYVLLQGEKGPILNSLEVYDMYILRFAPAPGAREIPWEVCLYQE